MITIFDNNLGKEKYTYFTMFFEINAQPYRFTKKLILY